MLELPTRSNRKISIRHAKPRCPTLMHGLPKHNCCGFECHDSICKSSLPSIAVTASDLSVFVSVSKPRAQAGSVVTSTKPQFRSKMPRPTVIGDAGTGRLRAHELSLRKFARRCACKAIAVLHLEISASGTGFSSQSFRVHSRVLERATRIRSFVFGKMSWNYAGRPRRPLAMSSRHAARRLRSYVFA